MEGSSTQVFNIFLVFALVILNGFFVAVEFALVRSHPTKLKSTDYRGKFGVGAALKLVDDLDVSLSAVQLGITVASLVLGWWGELALARLFEQLFAALGAQAALLLSHATATVLALTVVTLLHVVLGELVAKSLAIRFPEPCLRILAPPMLVFVRLFAPVIFAMTRLADLVLRLFGVRAAVESERVHSLSELVMLVSHSTERGVLDKSEEEMLHGVFNFAETIAREVMTPRPDLVTVPAAATLDETLDVFSESGLSRLPVTGESVDDIVGILLIRDLLPFLHHYSHAGPQREFSVTRIMREPYFVPGTKRIDDLLNEFKRRKIHLAIVLDEHGGVDGLVTLEDLIEEIVGDIFDESDVAERDIVVQENGDVVVDGGVLVADINDRLQFEIPEGDYDTIAGFILTSLGRLPKPGDTILITRHGHTVVNGVETSPVRHEVTEDAELNGKAGGDASASEDKLPRIGIIVERVKGRRVEAVRLQRFVHEDDSETLPHIAASEGKTTIPSEG